MTFELFSVSSSPLFLEYFFFSKIPHHFRLTCVILWFSYLCSCPLSSIIVCIFIFGEIVLQSLIAKRAPGSWAECLLTGLLMALSASAPALLPLILNIAVRKSPSKCHSEHVSPVLNLSNGLGTSIKVSKTLHRPSLLYLSDIIFYISFLLSFFLFWSFWPPWGSSSVPGTFALMPLIFWLLWLEPCSSLDVHSTCSLSLDFSLNTTLSLISFLDFSF